MKAMRDTILCLYVYYLQGCKIANLVYVYMHKGRFADLHAWAQFLCSYSLYYYTATVTTHVPQHVGICTIDVIVLLLRD